MTTPPTKLAGWPLDSSPFHAGEQAVQERVGVRANAEAIGRRVIRDFMPDQHRTFFEQLPFFLLGTLDEEGRPWASMIVGEPGFVRSPDPRHLRVAYGTSDGAATLAAGDPARSHLHVGAHVGGLGIQLETRRRNRINGTIVARDEASFTLEVGQSFGNCAQYIQARAPRFVPPEAGSHGSRVAFGALLPEAIVTTIRAADTFFLATTSPQAASHRGDAVHGVDVSHRGGKPGFVRVTENDGTTVLTCPDFLGNFHFNTFGNLELDPRTGVLFVDFATGDVITLTGTAEVVWNGPELEAFEGAERLLRFRAASGFLLPGALPLRWDAPVQAPQLARTGSWEDVERVVALAAKQNVARPFRVARVIDECDGVRSLELEPADGLGIAPHAPGQHLPVILDVAGSGAIVRRTYTISSEPNGRTCRVSVKRDATPGHPAGVASGHLHSLSVGDTLRALAPRGSFVLDTASTRPVVLVSAGIGVTPMIAMLEHLAGGNEERVRYPARRLYFLHGARRRTEHAFAAHVDALAERHPLLEVHVRYSQELEAPSVSPRTSSSVGRIDATFLRSVLPLDDYDFYVCGPAAFMQNVYDALVSLGVRDERIRAEAFGPSRIRRRSEERARDEISVEREFSHERELSKVPVERATVEYRASSTTAAWNASKGTLLELAEAREIAAPFSCREGTCGTCAAKLLEGDVAYPAKPTVDIPRGCALLCCAVPASERVVIDL